MSRVKVLALILLYSLTTAAILHGFKMLTGLWTIEVYQEGFESGLRHCPKSKIYKTMPIGDELQVNLDEPKNLMH